MDDLASVLAETHGFKSKQGKQAPMMAAKKSQSAYPAGGSASWATKTSSGPGTGMGSGAAGNNSIGGGGGGGGGRGTGGGGAGHRARSASPGYGGGGGGAGASGRGLGGVSMGTFIYGGGPGTTLGAADVFGNGRSSGVDSDNLFGASVGGGGRGGGGGGRSSAQTFDDGFANSTKPGGVSDGFGRSSSTGSGMNTNFSKVSATASAFDDLLGGGVAGGNKPDTRDDFLGQFPSRAGSRGEAPVSGANMTDPFSSAEGNPIFGTAAPPPSAYPFEPFIPAAMGESTTGTTTMPGDGNLDSTVIDAFETFVKQGPPAVPSSKSSSYIPPPAASEDVRGRDRDSGYSAKPGESEAQDRERSKEFSGSAKRPDVTRNGIKAEQQEDRWVTIEEILAKLKTDPSRTPPPPARPPPHPRRHAKSAESDYQGSRSGIKAGGGLGASHSQGERGEDGNFPRRNLFTEENPQKESDGGDDVSSKRQHRATGPPSDRRRPVAPTPPPYGSTDSFGESFDDFVSGGGVARKSAPPGGGKAEETGADGFDGFERFDGSGGRGGERGHGGGGGAGHEENFQGGRRRTHGMDSDSPRHVSRDSMDSAAAAASASSSAVKDAFERAQRKAEAAREARQERDEKEAAVARAQAQAQARVQEARAQEARAQEARAQEAKTVPRSKSSSKLNDPVVDLFGQSNVRPQNEPRQQTQAQQQQTSQKASTPEDWADILGGSGAGSFGAAAGGTGGVPGDFQEVTGESEERRKLRLERHQKVQERAAAALEEKKRRDVEAQKEQEDRHKAGEVLDVEIKRWASGKEGNIRALLSTLQFVLWPECKWDPVALTDLISGASVKKAYRKAALCVHPDKVQQKGATVQQKYIAEKVFDLLKEAFNKFNSEELF